jgi:hypothetical protein
VVLNENFLLLSLRRYSNELEKQDCRQIRMQEKMPVPIVFGKQSANSKPEESDMVSELLRRKVF